MDESETISVSVQLPKALCLDIDEYAREQGYDSRSAVIRAALADSEEEPRVR